MKIVSVLDRRLKVLIEDSRATKVKGLEPLAVRKLIEMIGAIKVMDHPLQLGRNPQWRAHELKPGRPGIWAMRVTPNWRLTFYVDIPRQEVSLLNLEDYH